jgi:oxygen-independent coproporphyrinogen-3 oxidase
MVSEKALPPLSLYIHFPWCIRKCPYCDFNSHEIKSEIPEAKYIDALLADLQHELSLLVTQPQIISIFMGGGTPSLFSATQIGRLLSEIKKCVSLSDDCEITMEANPGSFESAKFHEFRAIGINRLSIGIQTFNEQYLKDLGRIHNAKEAIRAVEIASNAGFENFNLDFMFGLPGQTVAEALHDIQTAIALKPTHISFYQLTLEPNTYFYKYPPLLPDDEDIFSAQKASQTLLAENGYQQYEVSAYALPGYQCQHNKNYWQFGDYLGIGAGAHGKITLALPDQILRTAKPKNPDQYLKQIDLDQRHLIAVAQLPLEFLMNSLRLSDGFSLDDYQRVTGLGKESLEPTLTQCLNQSLLIEHQKRFSCSAKGWDFLDVILEKFCP